MLGELTPRMQRRIYILKQPLWKNRNLQILTANSLNDGAVVYYQDHKTWSQKFDCAHTFPSVKDAKRCLSEVTKAGDVDLVGVYVISVEHVASKTCPLSMREKIRAQGPSILSQNNLASDILNAA